MVETLAELFRAESGQHERLVGNLRKVANQVSPPAISVWLEPPSGLGEPLTIGVLHDSRAVSRYVRELRLALTAVEREFELTAEISGFTRADLPVTLPEEWVLLGGVPPTFQSDGRGEQSGLPTHEDRDRKSQNRAQALADLVRSDPTLIDRASAHVARLLESDRGMATFDLEEWNEVLRSYSGTRLLRFLSSESPRAVRLRQSSPFLAILTPRERKQLAAAMPTATVEE